MHVVIRTANEVSSFEEDLFWVECSRIFRKCEKSQMILKKLKILITELKCEIYLLNEKNKNEILLT